MYFCNTESPISQFYQGRTVLVTGATGFLGKVVVEKLLRSTQVKRIYLLLRRKKDKPVNQRFTELFNDVLFSMLKEEAPDYSERVRPVEGDITLPGLGLSADDTSVLQAEVEVVFNGAATVRFDDPLEYAVRTNVKSTFEMLRLARTFPKLKGLVHISTAYANCTQSTNGERTYEPPLSGDNLIQLAESLDESTLSALTPLLIKGYPNTYIYTKTVAEDIIKVHGTGLPLIIFRPSMVVATATEPLKGWLDNINGPNGVICGVGLGVLRALHADRRYVADIVPVDMVANAVITCATTATTATSQENGRSQTDVDVYNYVSSVQNPLTWQQLHDIAIECGNNNPPVKSIWCYSMTMVRNKFAFFLCHLLVHFLPAVFGDTALLLCGKTPMLMKAFRQVDKFSSATAFFSTRMWFFDNERVQRHWNSMTHLDQRNFNFDISSLDWNLFFKNFVAGVRLYMFKETPDTLKEAIKRQFRFRLLNRLLQFILVSIIILISWKAISIIPLWINSLNITHVMSTLLFIVLTQI